MSYMRLPSASEEKLPEVESESEINIAPIVVTLGKCKNQILATFSSGLGMLCIGTVFGWGPVAIAQIKKTSISFDEATLASIFIIGAIISGPLSGYLMIKIGRRLSLLLYAVLILIGWLFFVIAAYCSENTSIVAMMYIGRFLTGFAGAAFLVIVPVYVREICADEYRGLFGGTIPVMLMVGNLYAYVVGVLTTWVWLSIACMIFPVSMIILMIYMPEPPRRLLLAGKKEQAKKAFYWLTAGFPSEEQRRLHRRLERAVECLVENKKIEADTKEALKAIKSPVKVSIKSRGVMLPIIISVLLVFFQQASGVNTITTYTLEILEDSREIISPELGTNLLGVLFLIFVIVALFIVEEMGRKLLLEIGCALKATMAFSLGTYFYLKHIHSSLAPSLTWIPIVACVVYVCAYSLGMGSVPWTLSTEISHPDYRELTGTLVSFTYWITAFIVTASFPALRDSIGYHNCYWLYGVSCTVAFFYVFFCVYETKGKTADDIMAHYQGLQEPAEIEFGNEAGRHSIGSIKPGARRSQHRRYSTASAVDSQEGSQIQILFEDNNY